MEQIIDESPSVAESQRETRERTSICDKRELHRFHTMPSGQAGALKEKASHRLCIPTPRPPHPSDDLVCLVLRGTKI